jgi:hypothetical protein
MFSLWEITKYSFPQVNFGSKVSHVMKASLMNRIRCFVLLFSVTAAGCMHTGQPVASEKLAQIKKGKTTKSQVIELLGPPSHQFPGMMSYENMQSNFAATAVVGSIIPGAGLFTPSSVNTQSIQVWLDPHDVVKDVIVNRTGSNGSAFSQMTGRKPMVTQTSGSQ